MHTTSLLSATGWHEQTPDARDSFPLLATLAQPRVTFGEGGTVKSKVQILKADGQSAIALVCIFTINSHEDDSLYYFLLNNLTASHVPAALPCTHTVTDIVANEKDVRTKVRTILDSDFVGKTFGTTATSMAHFLSTRFSLIASVRLLKRSINKLHSPRNSLSVAHHIDAWDGRCDLTRSSVTSGRLWRF
jgi:hypothetical protein